MKKEQINDEQVVNKSNIKSRVCPKQVINKSGISQEQKMAFTIINKSLEL